MFKYEILRPCLWFAKGEIVEVDKFREYFTSTAIVSLLNEDFIKVTTKN